MTDDTTALARRLLARVEHEPPLDLVDDVAAYVDQVVEAAVKAVTPPDGDSSWPAPDRAPTPSGDRTVVHNSVTGNATNVIQAGTISGGVYLGGDQPRRRRS